MEEIAENPQTQDVPETSATDVTELNEKGRILYSKVKIYDVVFKRFFAVDENVKKFYESVSNRKIRLEDIERVTLEEGKSFETQIANDLGFLVKNDDGQDEFVFLVEAQSTWNDNMPYRFWDYLVAGEGDKPDKLSFAEKMFKSGKRDGFDLDFGIHVITSPDSKTVPGQYVGFSKSVSHLRKECENYGQFMKKLREECCKKEYNLFVDFIDEHRAEMEIDMEQAFRNEQEFDDFLDERDRRRDEIVKKQTVIELYTKGLLSAEAAKELNMTVPAFLDLVKASV